jgi:crotonobetainyl-CoA:carnitine CoA-transferase CaiB-like acyl-CoA transferase
MSMPLEGIRVIDFTQVMMGPCATQMLGDYGADVIKVERPGTGDLSRTSYPDPAGLQNPVYCSLNRNKRSIALDLRDGQKKALLRRLIDGADAVVNNFRAGVMERMGFGYEELSRTNPRLIYAVGTGYGPAGPYAHKGGQDVLAQAMSGVMARLSDPDLPMSIYATALADYACGMHLVQGILLALLQRQKTGRGQMVSVSLYDSMLAMQMQEGAMQLMRDHDLNWGAMPLSGVFATRDGAVVLVGAFKTHPLRDISTALEVADLSLDPRFADHAAQVKNRRPLHAVFRERFASNTTQYWIARLEEQDLLCAPVKTMKAALADEQTRVNGMILEGRGSDGAPLRLVGSPIHMSAADVQTRRPPPRLGEHTDEILAELTEHRRGATA